MHLYRSNTRSDATKVMSTMLRKGFMNNQIYSEYIFRKDMLDL